MNKKVGIIIIVLLVLSVVIITLTTFKTQKTSIKTASLLENIAKKNTEERFYSMVSHILYVTQFHRGFLSLCVKHKGIIKARMEEAVKKWDTRNKKYIDLAWNTKGLDEDSVNKQKYLSMMVKKKEKAMFGVNKGMNKKKKSIKHICKHQLSIFNKGDYDLANYPMLVKYYAESLQYLEKLIKQKPRVESQFDVY